MSEPAGEAAAPLLLAQSRWRLYGVLAVLMLISLWPLTRVADWWPLLAIPVIGIVVLLARWSKFCPLARPGHCAILVPWLCLIGFNQLLRWSLDRSRAGRTPGRRSA